LLEKYFKGPWESWYVEAEAVGYFFGVFRRKEKCASTDLSSLKGTRAGRLIGRAVIHTVKRCAPTSWGDDKAHDVRYVSDPSDIPFVCEESDLPVLAMSDNVSVANTAKSVLWDSKKRPVKNQKLTVKWEAMCRRIRRIRQVIQGYELLIDQWLGKRYPDRFHWYEDTIMEVHAESTGRIYFFLWPRISSGSTRSFKRVRREIVDVTERETEDKKG